MHNGVDLAISHGTPIKAAGSGKLEFVGKKSGYGRYILINHGGGYKTGYAHMSAFAQNLKAGATVTRGQLIGKVGSNGLSSGPHLHYEVIKRGAKVDPVYYFFNDLTPAQFDRLLKEAAANKQSLD